MHRRLLAAIPLVALARPGRAISLADIGGPEATTGLREALAQGAARAVDLLGRPDGFLGNAAVKILLPDRLQRVERLLRAAGMGAQVDELVVAMNRAAEQAVPQARALLVDAVKQMSVGDARSIIAGADDAATQYFRSKTAEPLATRFLPVVRRATERLRVAQQYDRLAGQAAALGLVSREDASIDRYVTRKALDGLYTTIAEQERAIRADPAQAAGRIARRVFGAAR